MKKDLVEPKTLPGFLELLPQEQIAFDKMLETIRESYLKFGFAPLDTPVLELSEVLLAKAGGETEKQIYSLEKGDNKMTMRFDLTVPLAKYVAKNYHMLTFPFRRYQIGKVWRGERPQNGRFREFYQCDIDIVGDGELSIINDAEIPAVIYHTFKNLGFDNFTIRVNNRKILGGLCQHIGAGERVADVLRIIDKIDKIGEDKVKKELEDLGLSQEAIKTVIDFIRISGTPIDICQKLSELGILNETYITGVDELKVVAAYIGNFGIPESNFKVDLTIARGLDYYTGTVYETVLNDHLELGSVCSGGRYDNLAGHFTDKKLPGVGISIGLSRLFFQLRKADVVKVGGSSPVECLIVPLDEDLSYSIDLATFLRGKGVSTSVYVEKKGMKQKMNYANKLQIPFVAIIGETELANREVALKNMMSGEQECIKFEDTAEKILAYFNK